MIGYEKEYRGLSPSVPERFSFPLDAFDEWGERTALFWTDGITEKKYSFNEMRMSSSKGAGALKRIGIGKGDKVLVMLSNIPEWWEIMLSLMRLNAVPIPATTHLVSKDIEYRLSATEVKAVIASEEDTPKVEDAANGLSVSPLLILVGERQGWHNYMKERDRADMVVGERGSAQEPAMIYFTSGTTGPPKMVVHTHASYSFAHQLTGKYWLDLRPGDIHWNLSDTGWAKAAWSSLFGPRHREATIFSLRRKGKFDPSFILEVMQRILSPHSAVLPLHTG